MDSPEVIVVVWCYPVATDDCRAALTGSAALFVTLCSFRACQGFGLRKVGGEAPF
jgi:hypothetical protein